METMFLFCAIFGGGILVVQFLMTMLGFIHMDMPDGIHMDGLDAADGLHAADALHASDGLQVADGLHASDGLHAGGVEIDGATDTSLPVTFGLFSFRAMTAAMTFFGLTGMLMYSLQAGPLPSVAVALAAGFGSMFLVAWIIRSLYQFQSDGTARIGRAINHRASVYVPIPAEGEGKGKIQVNLQGRTMEYEALTAGRAIRSGDTVLIRRVIDSNTVEVEPAFDVEED